MNVDNILLYDFDQEGELIERTGIINKNTHIPREGDYLLIKSITYRVVMVLWNYNENTINIYVREQK